MYKYVIYIATLLLWSHELVIAEDSWLCTTESSKVVGNMVQSCGIGKAKDENDARVQAFQNAQFEFYRICKASDFCSDRKVSVEPKRTTCEETKAGYKCIRLIEFTLADEKNDRTVSSVNYHSLKKLHYVEFEPGSGGGYKDSMETETVSASTFIGNSRTPLKQVVGLSRLRAQEVCFERGAKICIQMSGKNTSTQTVVKGKRTIFPSYVTYFRCANQSSGIGASARELPPIDIKPFVKDLMGAVQITAVLEDSPNRGKIQIGDIILKVNGNRITTVSQFISEINSDIHDEKIPLKIVRDGKPISVSLKRLDTTEQTLKANTTSKEAACKLHEIADRPFCKIGLSKSTLNN